MSEVASEALVILSLALAPGYGSHEAFTRTFHDTFGLPLAEVRKRGHINGLALLIPMRVMEEAVLPAPALRAEVIGPLLLTGIETSYLSGDTAGILSQWQRLHPDHWLDRYRYSYRVCSMMDGEGRLDYLARYELNNFCQAPAGY